jgi:hypothetical protein
MPSKVSKVKPNKETLKAFASIPSKKQKDGSRMVLCKKPYEILIRNIKADDKILRGLNNSAAETKR